METIKEYHPNNKIKREYSLNNNKMIEGTYKTWLDDGSIFTQHVYVNGKTIEGILFNPDGSIKCRETYSDGRRHGEYIYFDEYGNKVGSCYYVNGVKQGEEYIYYDGKVMVLTTYKDGIRNGPHKTFFNDGKKEISCNYLNGKLHGENNCWDEDGNLVSRCIYINGIKQE
jgi:antitoxin component YwqK of YwqJK toxin-antitoxin module